MVPHCVVCRVAIKIMRECRAGALWENTERHVAVNRCGYQLNVLWLVVMMFFKGVKLFENLTSQVRLESPAEESSCPGSRTARNSLWVFSQKAYYCTSLKVEPRGGISFS